MLKSRDVFDISVIDAIDGDALKANLHEVTEKKEDLLRHLDGINEDFLQAELAELDIRPGWEKHKKTCLQTVRTIVGKIPNQIPGLRPAPPDRHTRGKPCRIAR
jgi:hypothetical protein